MSAPINQGVNQVLIGLGSNIDPEKNLPLALALLAEKVQIIQSGSIWQSPAFGSTGPDYLNSAVLVQSELPLEDFKVEILAEIENELGRVRREDKYADRTIDLDVLTFNNQILDDELWTQPHVAIPAAEIKPGLKNPTSGEKISQAAERLQPGSGIRKRTDLS